MNIGIWANCLIFEKAGVGKYTQNIINKLIKIDKKNQYFLYFAYFRHRREREELAYSFLGGDVPENVTLRFLSIPAQWFEFLTSTPFPIKKLITDKIDVFFSPYASGIPKNGFEKMAVTIHDLVFIRFPEHRGKNLSNYYLKRHRIAIKNCKKIIVPSLATKRDLQVFLSVSPRKIKVIPEAADNHFRIIKNKLSISQIASHYVGAKTKYILSVGTIEPRKNLIKLIGAYSLLPHSLQNEYKLVLVGPKGWNSVELFKRINNLNLKDKIILPGFVNDDDLPYIYNQASIFVYPSLFEGFGLPPLEAMACGAPVVAGNHSSIVEVVGKAGILVDCRDEDKLSHQIKRVLLKPKLAQNLAKKGHEQAKKFSWERAAQETLEILESL